VTTQHLNTADHTMACSKVQHTVELPSRDRGLGNCLSWVPPSSTSWWTWVSGPPLGKMSWTWITGHKGQTQVLHPALCLLPSLATVTF
jgi:hypothetical protein